jgi:hypothetical protein
MKCLLINYDGGSQLLLSQYIHRAECQELTLTLSPAEYLSEPEWWKTCDLIFLHLTHPDETVRSELAAQLINHTGVVITSPLPKHQFHNLFVQPFAFLTEPFSFKMFMKCIVAYQSTVQKEM